MLTLAKLSRAVNQCIEYVLFGLGFSMSIIVAVHVSGRFRRLLSERASRHRCNLCPNAGHDSQSGGCHRPLALHNPFSSHDHLRDQVRLLHPTPDIAGALSAQMARVCNHSIERNGANVARPDFFS